MKVRIKSLEALYNTPTITVNPLGRHEYEYDSSLFQDTGWVNANIHGEIYNCKAVEYNTVDDYFCYSIRKEHEFWWGCWPTEDFVEETIGETLVETYYTSCEDDEVW